MSKIRNIIIILILLILIIIISIFLLNIKQNDVDNAIYSEDGDIGDVIEITNQVEDVKDITTFKTVELCVQKYYNMLNDESSNFYGRNEDGSYVKVVSDAEIKQMRLDLLSDEFIENNNINLNNISKYINSINEQGTVVALKMKEIVNNPIEKYIVQGILISFNNEVLNEFYICVNLDIINQTFSIEPILDEYEDIDEIKTNNTNKTIEINDNNKYSRDVYDYEDMARNYFLTYKRLALAKPELLYNYMDTEYKNKRFGNESVFKKYIVDNTEEIQGLRLTEYLVNYEENITQFVCKDQYENLYIFDELLPMQFSLKLDTYTLTTDNFRETYEKSNDIEKVQLNIDMFIKMINRHDYISSYNCISEGFRNNYFKTQEDFENFILNNFFLYNKCEYKNYEKKGSNIYVFTIQLTDLTEESSEIKEMNIIMQLNDDLDFEMSFGI